MSDNVANSLEIQEQFSDTLLVLDKESNTVNTVKKIGKNGELETVKPIKSNQPQFIRIDKGGDLFTNFFSNFIRQLKNPTKFNFFKVALPDAVDTATKLQRHFKKPTADGEALYNKHIISTELIRQLLDSTEKQSEILKELTKHNEQIMEQKNEQSEYRFKMEDINWDRMAQYGITKEKLEKNNQLDVLLKGYKTNELITVSADLGSEIMKFDARLSLQQKENGDVVLAFHGVRRQPNLNLEFFGHQFTEEDRNNLIKTGNMGRVVELINPRNKEEVFPSVISVDRLTNELVAYKTEYIKIPDEIKGVQLDDVQKQTLLEGKALMIDGMTSQQGNTFSGLVQFNADKRYVEFVRNINNLNQFKIQQNGSSQKVAEVPREFRGKELTQEQFNSLKNGETVFIDNLVSQKGSIYEGYITYDPKEKQIKFQFPKDYKEKSQSAGNGETTAAGDSVQKANQKPKEANESMNTGQHYETKQQDLPSEKPTNRGRKI